jgi:hypothetical protein
MFYLEQLQRYLEVSDEQVLGAAASLAMLSPVGRTGVELIQDTKNMSTLKCIKLKPITS